MTIFNVSTAAELTSAISRAAGGDQIVVADGNYGAVKVFDRAFSSTVTITAANPGTGAHFDTLFVAGVKNLNVVGVDVGRPLAAGEPDYSQLSYVKGSSNVTLSGVTIHGSQDGDPSNDGIGLTVADVTGFTLTGSHFSDLYRGVVVQRSTNTTIQDNDITLIRSDGIISIANDGLSIQGNRIGEFHPKLGDHADAIQFWNTGQTKGQSDITIKDNVLFQSYFSGIETTGVQGIFISDAGTYGFHNILIQNNALYSNDAFHGIFVNGATGVQILDNTVVSKSTDSKLFWIDVLNSADISVQNNITDRIITANVTNYFQSGNTDFLANPAARAILPNLADPTSVHDLIAAGTGYGLPTSMPASPVSGAVGSEITQVGGSSTGHGVILESPSASLGGLLTPVVETPAPTQTVAAPQFNAGATAHDFSAVPHVNGMQHLFIEHFVAIA